MLCNDVTTNKAWAALTFLLVLVIILRGTVHGSHANFAPCTQHLQTDIGYELFFKWNDWGWWFAQDTTKSSLSVPEAHKSLFGKKWYFITQSYIVNVRKWPFHIRLLVFFFIPDSVPHFSSSKSGNQHHGELLSGKEKKICAENQNYYTFSVPNTECVQAKDLDDQILVLANMYMDSND